MGSDQEPVRDEGAEQALVEPLGPNTGNFQNVLFIGIHTLFDQVTRGYGDHSLMVCVCLLPVRAKAKMKSKDP